MPLELTPKTPPYYNETTNAVKKYVGFMKQTGTNAPVVREVFNTIGNIVWTRNSAGIYRGTLTGAFKSGKTVCTPFSYSGGITVLGLSNSLPGDYTFSISGMSPNVGVFEDYVEFNCFETATFNNVDLSTAIINSEVLITIEVYP